MCWIHIRTSGAFICYRHRELCYRHRILFPAYLLDAPDKFLRAAYWQLLRYWQSPCPCHVIIMVSSLLQSRAVGAARPVGSESAALKVSLVALLHSSSSYIVTLLQQGHGHWQMLTHKKIIIIDMYLHSTPLRRILNYLWLFTGAGRLEQLYFKPLEPKKLDNSHDEGQVKILQNTWEYCADHAYSNNDEFKLFVEVTLY